MEGRGHGPTLPTNRLGAASALGTACGGTSQSGIRGVAERGGSAHYQGCDGQWERRGRGDGGGTCGRARVRVGQPQPGRNRRRCRDSATGSGTGTEGRGERHRAGTAPPQRPPPAGDSDPMEPSRRSPGSGDGIGTETPPRAPPGPPRCERGRKRRAGGDPELPPVPRGAKRPKDGDGGPRHSSPPPSDGDRLFAQKCRELRGFIRPLTELLNGLRMGRYDKGLSSFQQSVAMDRIQRIIGVLQKPEMGARYLGTLLQVEVMLKVWFPHVAPKAGPEPDPVGVLLLLRDRRSAHGDGATSGTSGGTSGTASGVTAETTPTGTTQPKCPLPTRTGAPTPPAAPDV